VFFLARARAQKSLMTRDAVEGSSTRVREDEKSTATSGSTSTSNRTLTRCASAGSRIDRQRVVRVLACAQQGGATKKVAGTSSVRRIVLLTGFECAKQHDGCRRRRQRDGSSAPEAIEPADEGTVVSARLSTGWVGAVDDVATERLSRKDGCLLRERQCGRSTSTCRQFRRRSLVAAERERVVISRWM